MRRSIMKSNIKISVIMSTYREDIGFLRTAVESILNQTYTNFEFLIAGDDPENEELIKVIRKYEDQDSRIKFFINEKNLGLVDSLNGLLKHTTGEYIARMDADDYSYENRLEKQLDRALETGADMMSAFVRVVDEQGNVIREMNRLPVDNAGIQKSLKKNNCMPHPAWFVKAEVYRRLGGYRQVAYCEDYDFILRAREEGFSFANCEEILFDYRMTVNSISRSNLFKQFISMNYVQEKYIKGRELDYKEYYDSHYSKEKEEKYCRCANYLSEALIHLKQKKYIKGLFLTLKAYCGSREYQKKMWAYLLQEVG